MKNLTGRVFQCLVVEKFAHVDGRGQSIWRCKCTCGKTTLASSGQLNAGRKGSCGHLRKEWLDKHKRKIWAASPDPTRTREFTSIDEALEELEAYG